MGLGTALLGLFSFEKSVEATIEAQVMAYGRAKSAAPWKTHHELLIDVYIARLRAHGMLQIDRETQSQAVRDTGMFASLPTASALRAMGLWIASQERPDQFGRNVKLTAELEQLMMPVFRSIEDGSYPKNYKEYQDA